MHIDLLLKAAEFRREIGYINAQHTANDCRIVNFYSNITTINKVRELMNRHRNRNLLTNPAQVVLDINDIINHVYVPGDRLPSDMYVPRKIHDAIVSYAKCDGNKLLPPFNIILQDVINVLQTGIEIDFGKYSYVLNRDYTLNTFDGNRYTLNFDIKVPSRSLSLPSTDAQTLIQVLGIEKTVYLLGLLINFGCLRLY